jgi:hypothetical protein
MSRLSRALLLALTALPGLACAQSAMKSATWWNPDEGGWGVFTIDQGNVVAPGWFTYDSDGEPVWFLVPGATLQGDGSYKGDILRFTGVPFAQISGSAADPASKVGEATMRFSGDKAMSFTTVIGGASQTKSLVRFNFSGNDLVCKSTTAPRTASTNYSDLWSSPGSSGWGVHISHLDTALYATWYTYDPDREAIFLIGSLTRQPDGSFTGPLLRQKNGTPYSQINGARPSAGADAIGTATLRFSDGETGTFSYTVGSVTQSKTIKRSQFGSTASVCSVEPYQATATPPPATGSGDTCFPAYALGDTRNVRVTGTANGAASAPATHRERITATATFNGQSGFVQEYDGQTSAGTGVYARNYVGNGSGTAASFGAEALNPASGAVISTSVNEPARVEMPLAFSVGETKSLAWKVRATASGVNSTIDVYSTWKLLGRESVTVPAGTFNACKFEISFGETSTINGVNTDTDLTGTAWTSPVFGLLKQVSAGTSRVSAFGQNIDSTLTGTQELMSATAGGQSTP